jgi:DNA-binding MarR family transcriptional regulator
LAKDAKRNDVLIYEALANLRYTLRRFMAFSAVAAQAAGLPPQQHQALLAIKGNPSGQPMTVGLLAERLLIAPHTATELVGRLDDGGLVTKVTNLKDRRRLTLSLTPKAEEILASLSLTHLRELRELTPVLVDALRTLHERGGC